MENLFRHTTDFDDILKRNIVSLRSSEDLFDDLNDGDEHASQVGHALTHEVKKDIPSHFLDRGFHYTTAIDYPFSTEPFLQSRYGTGEFPVWYGSLTLETTLYETAFHMFREENKIQHNENVIYRERAVYDVDCKAILLDFRGKETQFPQLISNDYGFTQPVGKRVYEEGHPGLLVPSARTKGANSVIFNRKVLLNARIGCYLNYTLIRDDAKVIIERAPGEIIGEISV